MGHIYKTSSTEALQLRFIDLQPKAYSWSDLELSDAGGQIITDIFNGLAVPAERLISHCDPLELLGYTVDDELVVHALVSIAEDGYLSLTKKGEVVMGFAENLHLYSPPPPKRQPERGKTCLAVRPLKSVKAKKPTPKFMKPILTKPNFDLVKCDGVLVYNRLEKVAQALFDLGRWNGYSRLFITSVDKIGELYELGASLEDIPITDGRVWMSPAWIEKHKDLPKRHRFLQNARLLDPNYGKQVLGAKREERRL